LACGGRLPAGAAVCPAGGVVCAAVLLWPKQPADLANTATRIMIAVRFMLSPSILTILVSESAFKIPMQSGPISRDEICD
jgi:hypothetical protein